MYLFLMTFFVPTIVLSLFATIFHCRTSLGYTWICFSSESNRGTRKAFDFKTHWILQRRSRSTEYNWFYPARSKLFETIIDQRFTFIFISSSNVVDWVKVDSWTGLRMNISTAQKLILLLKDVLFRFHVAEILRTLMYGNLLPS